MLFHSFVLVSFFLSLFLLFLFLLGSKSHFFNTLGKSPFECGFKSESLMSSSYSSHYITVALLFLLFDLEIVLVMPSPLVGKFSLFTFSSVSLFMLFLFMALLVEWSKGMLDWNS